MPATYKITPHRNGYRVTDESGAVEIVSGKRSMMQPSQFNVFEIAYDCRLAGAIDGEIDTTRFDINSLTITVTTVAE